MALLLVDQNEAATAPYVVERLKSYFGAGSVVLTNLPMGDIAISLQGGGTLRIERKTVKDFCSSIADGRLARQVDGMVKSGAWSAVVVTGLLRFDEDDMLFTDDARSGWHGSAIRSAMRSVVFAGALLEQCESADFPRVIEELIKFTSKPSHAQYHPSARKHKPLIDFYPEETLLQERVEFLMSLPGVGSKLARSLLDWCGPRDHAGPGILGDALSWITVFPEMDQKSLPAGWTQKKAEEAKRFLLGDLEGILRVIEDGEHVPDNRDQTVAEAQASEEEIGGDPHD